MEYPVFIRIFWHKRASPTGLDRVDHTRNWPSQPQLAVGGAALPPARPVNRLRVPPAVEISACDDPHLAALFLDFRSYSTCSTDPERVG